MVADEAVLGVLRPGQHGSTFGGNPLACAVGSAVVDLLGDPAVLAHARDLGRELAARLDAPIASDVTDVSVNGDAITVKHPGYANKVIMTLTLSGSPVVP